MTPNPFEREDIMEKFIESMEEYERFQAYVEEKDKAKCDEEESDEEESSNIDVKYLYDDRYEWYEDFLQLEKGKLVGQKKEAYYLFDVSVFEADMYCKIRTVFCAESQNEMYTPYKLRNMDFIKTGRYSDWKSYIPDSSIADAFGMKEKKYKIEGIKELLQNTTICILLLWDCVRYRQPDKKSEFWLIVKKVIDAYNHEEPQINLTEEEKNTITRILVSNTLYEDPYLPYRKQDSSKKKMIQKLCKNIKPELESIQQKIREQGEYSSNNNIPKKSHGATIAFSAYLAPIAAAICEYFKDNPLFVEKPIWTSTILKEYLLIPNIKEDVRGTLSEKYAILHSYVEYVEELDELANKDDLVESYEGYCALILYKIMSEKNPIQEKDRFIQYYAMEQLIGLQFVEQMSKLIYRKLKELGNEVLDITLRKEHYQLERILQLIYRCNGVFTRIELAKAIIADYFSIYKKQEANFTSKCRKLKDQIFFMDKKFRCMEMIYIEDLSRLCIKKEGVTPSSEGVFQNGDTCKKDIMDRFDEYTRRIEALKKEEEKLYKNNGALTMHNIKKMAKRNCGKEKDKEMQLVENWVIKNTIFGNRFSQVEIK